MSELMGWVALGLIIYGAMHLSPYAGLVALGWCTLQIAEGIQEREIRRGLRT